MRHGKSGRRAGLAGLALLMTAALLGGCASDPETVETALVETVQADVAPIEPVEVVGEGQKASESETVETQAPKPEYETVDETVYVTADDVMMRSTPESGPGKTDNYVAQFSKGTMLKRKAKNAEWSKVIYHDEVYYMSSQFLSTELPEGVEAVDPGAARATEGAVSMDSSWKYADFSKINSGTATLYRSGAAGRKGKVVCVNAGHGTSGGSSVKTQCHPDGTPKVTGGTTSAGATTAVAVSSGMTFSDGTPEAEVTLAMAKVLKDKLLARGYDVLMIRETDDVQLDNIARTVMANNLADCHIALHWDSTTSNKGVFYMSVPNVSSYRSMEPVASNWQKHHALGDALISGLKGAGLKLFGNGTMEMDLTQTSFSTIPSIDIELGDKASDHSPGTLDTLGTGLADGVDQFFGS